MDRFDVSVTAAVTTAPYQPLRRIWRYIGYDEPNYTYAPNGARLLEKIGKLNDAPYWIRTHFLLCNGDAVGSPKWGSTNVYSEDSSGKAVYDWSVWDQIFDAIIERGCIPFVEIGFMPEPLSTAPPGTVYADPFKGGWRYPPKSYERWGEIVAAVAEHSLDRYGSREVSCWYWELWNEPDIFYWAGTPEEFFRLYDYTEHALHSVIPSARLGSPAVTVPGEENAGSFLDAFFAHCDHGTNALSGGSGTRLDYVTFHSKGSFLERDTSGNKHIPSVRTLTDHVAAGMEIMAKYPFLAGTELILTECDPDGWAAGSVQDNPNFIYRNTEYYASYLATAACALMDLSGSAGHRVDGMLTWAFEFEGRKYFEGLRTLASNEIEKPVFNAIRILSRLAPQRINASITARTRDDASDGGSAVAQPTETYSAGCIATTGEGDEISLLLSSHHDDWDVEGTAHIEVAFSGLRPEHSYEVELSSVDGVRANTYNAWRSMQCPQPPTSIQLEELHRAAELQPVRSQLRTDSSGRAFYAFDAAISSVHHIRMRIINR